MSSPAPAPRTLPLETQSGRTDLSVQIHGSMASAKDVWLDLETRGVFTPYQRYDWIAAYLESGFRDDVPMAIVVLVQDGHPIALIPFAISTRAGVRIAQVAGMEISNGDAILHDPRYGHLLTREILAASFRTLPADLVSFHCVAPMAGDIANPLLAFPHSAAPDHFFFNVLAPGDTPYIEHSLPHKRRTNIKRSRRRLAEGFGEVQLRAAQSEAEIDAMLDVFLAQRGKRFEQMGVENVFARPDFRRFFRRLAVEGLGHERPALRIHALYAGQNIVATSIGTYGPAHYSQYINSTDSGEASRYSLMGVTLSLLIDELSEAGITSIDMGLGDFDYKLDWTQSTTVHDIVIANSLLGQAAAPTLRAARGLKRTIKQTPHLWRAARAIRSLKTGLSSRSRG